MFTQEAEIHDAILRTGATPCTAYDALHYLATTCPFLRNFVIYDETYSPIVNPGWSAMTTHTHHVLSSTKCGALSPRPTTPLCLVPLAVLVVGELTVQGTISAFC